MAKKSGKKAPEVETNTPAVEADAQEKKSGKNNLFIDRHRSTLIHDLTSEKNGKEYKQINFPMGKTDAGETQWGKFLVSPGQVLESTKTDKDGNKTVIPGFNNILLGTKGQHYEVSYNSGTKENPVYEKKSMTCEDIKSACDSAKQGYYAARDAKNKAAEAETPVVDTPQTENEGIGDDELE